MESTQPSKSCLKIKTVLLRQHLIPLYNYSYVMRLYSTPESVERGEPTVLAIVETLFAIGAVCYLSWHLQNTTYIAIPACIAPFLLLRTDESTQRGVRSYKAMISFLGTGFFDRNTSSRLKAPLEIAIGMLSLYMYVMLPPLLVLVKFAVTAYCTIAHPLLALRSIPYNWTQIALCIDTLHHPEMLPGLTSNEKNLERTLDRETFHLFSLDTTRGLAIETRDMFKDSVALLLGRSSLKKRLLGIRLGLTVILSTLLFTRFAPSLVYRYSLKSTSIIYSPLLWILQPLNLTGRPDEHFRDKSDSVLNSIIFHYSLLVILLCTSKAYIFVTWEHIKGSWYSLTGLEVFHPFILPNQLPLWHVLPFFNA